MAWVWDIRLKAFSEKKVEAKTCLVSERKKSHRGADFIHPAGFDPLQNMDGRLQATSSRTSPSL